MFLQGGDALTFPAACPVFIAPDYLRIEGLLLERIYAQQL